MKYGLPVYKESVTLIKSSETNVLLFFFAFFYSFSPCSSLFWLHFHPGVHIIPFQVILFYLATGPHLHAVGEVAGSGRQDEVINQGSTSSSNDWANPENLEYKSKTLHQVFLQLKLL